MLYPVKEKSAEIVRAERRDDRLYLYSEAGMYRLEPKDSGTLRITYTQGDRFSGEEKPGVIFRQVYAGWEYWENDREIGLVMEQLSVVINRKTASFVYCDGQGNRLLKERDKDSKSLEEFTVYRTLEEGTRVEKEATPDGLKDVVREASRIPVGKSFHTRLYLEWAEGEALYGLGQHEEGFGSLRGQTVYLHQANRKIAVPMLISTLGYGILADTYSPMIFSDTIYGSYLYTEADPEMDFYFMNGGTMDGVVRKYRMLTGKAALLPRWAYGYIQSQERYETAAEILDTVKEYRQRGIGLDGIVLDWCSWEGNQWGQKTFDPNRFPDPAGMIKELHDNQVHFMISVWPNMGEDTENYKEFREKGLLLPACNIYNALCRQGRELYWEQIRRGLFSHGVDAWWCDSSEPFTPEWNHAKRVEPSVMYQEYCQTAGHHLPAEKMNAYSLYHAQAVYEGQRREERQRLEERQGDEEQQGKEQQGKEERQAVRDRQKNREKRVVNLTRSAYTGQQRYGTILWSGDIEASWETLRKQVAAGLHFSASGLPFWTVDIGAFFVKRGNMWFWKGEYDQCAEDPGYRELFVRWYQWGCFLPVFRGHGTDCRRELWHFHNVQGAAFYDALLCANRLRYELLPYIYSLAGSCWLKDESMIRLLAFAYPKDREVWNITDQYLFGNQIMVCPVLQPMYYENGSKPLRDVPKKRSVYLPGGNGWYDFWTNTWFEGGRWIDAQAPIERIPLFVREGSILPVAKINSAGNCSGANILSVQEACEQRNIMVYSGVDGAFSFYEDAGDGYGYEQGEFLVIDMEWNERERKLSARKSGNYLPQGNRTWNGEIQDNWVRNGEMQEKRTWNDEIRGDWVRNEGPQGRPGSFEKVIVINRDGKREERVYGESV